MSGRIILLVAGKSGSGKSFFVANLKNALIADTDIGGGLEAYDERIKRNGSVRFECGSYLDLMDRLRERDLQNINTLVIDHLSTLHQEAVIRHNPTFREDTFGREHDRARKEWMKVREVARTGDFNLVCVSHTKDEYKNKKVVGTTEDASKNIGADFHIRLQLELGGPNQFPATAHVVKWRRDPDDPRGRAPSSFPFTVEEFTRLSGGFGGERAPIPLATAEQVKELNLLLSLLRVPQEDVKKWLAKAKVEKFEEFSAAGIAKAISDLDARLRARKPYGTNGEREPGVEDEATV